MLNGVADRESISLNQSIIQVLSHGVSEILEFLYAESHFSVPTPFRPKFRGVLLFSFGVDP